MQQLRERHPDQHVDLSVKVLQDRAASLRERAGMLHPLVARAYHRRASELELAAWATAVRAGRPAPTSRPRFAA